MSTTTYTTAPQLDLKFLVQPPTSIPLGSPLPHQVVIRFTCHAAWAPSPQEFLLFQADFDPVIEPSPVATHASDRDVNDITNTSILIAVSSAEVQVGRDLVSFKTSAAAIAGIYCLRVSAFVCRRDYVGIDMIAKKLVARTVSRHVHVTVTPGQHHHHLRHDIVKWLVARNAGAGGSSTVRPTAISRTVSALSILYKT
ncbi:hypothetical protein V8E54_006928 [Elaphomyces granulatus]